MQQGPPRPHEGILLLPAGIQQPPGNRLPRGRTPAEALDAVGHQNRGITIGYLHVAVDNDEVGELFRLARPRLRCTDTGSRRTRRNRKGQEVEVGEYALHNQCPWRIVGPDGIIVGSEDHNYSEDENADREQFDSDGPSGCKARMVAWLKEYSTAPLKVQRVKADPIGGFPLLLQHGERRLRRDRQWLRWLKGMSKRPSDLPQPLLPGERSEPCSHPSSEAHCNNDNLLSLPNGT